MTTMGRQAHTNAERRTPNADGGSYGGWWRGRAGFVGALLTGLYVVLYILLSLEAYSLLIGALLLFAALAGVMYLTRNLEWGGRREAEAAPVAG